MPRNRDFQSLFNQNKYRDVLLFLVLIPLINAINYYLTYSSISFGWRTLATFLIDTATGYIAWMVIRFVIVMLDERLPYGTAPLKRIVIQIAFSTVTALLAIIIITELVNFVATDQPVPRSFYLFDLFIFAIWCLVVNGIYIGFHFYNEWRTAEFVRATEKQVRRDGFLVDQGKQSYNIPFDQIFSMTIEGEYVLLFTTGSKKFYLDLSLDTCQETLPEEWFFRLNRQFIIHRNSIAGFTRLENGKLNVVLHPGKLPLTEIQVSRTKAPAFKSWFAASS